MLTERRKGQLLSLLAILISMLTACNTLPDKRIYSNDWQQATKNVIAQYSPFAERRLRNLFRQAKMNYPPRKVAFLTFKDEQLLELWAQNKQGQWRYVHEYPLTANSGQIGPKLLEADRQIPEGIYRIVNLNPFSNYHLSMMLNYPNQFDRQQARREGRRKLGDNIFIHGKDLSAGCIAVGDHAINQLFVLVNKVGLNNTKVIIAPQDFRHKPLPKVKNKPSWLATLYRTIQEQLAVFV